MLRGIGARLDKCIERLCAVMDGEGGLKGSRQGAARSGQPRLVAVGDSPADGLTPEAEQLDWAAELRLMRLRCRSWSDNR